MAGWRCSAQGCCAEESREVVPEGAVGGGLLSVVNPSFSLGRTWLKFIEQSGVVLRINSLDSWLVFKLLQFLVGEGGLFPVGAI